MSMRRLVCGGIVFSMLAVGGPAQADVYTAEDFRNGVLAYEALYGAHRQRDPQREGAAFEFLGYVKANIDQHNGVAFCLKRASLARAVSALVREAYRSPDLLDRSPQSIVLGVLGREYPCVSTRVEGRTAARID